MEARQGGTPTGVDRPAINDPDPPIDDREEYGLGIDVSLRSPYTPRERDMRTPSGSRTYRNDGSQPDLPWTMQTPQSGRLTGSTVRSHDAIFDDFAYPDIGYHPSHVHAGHQSKQSLQSLQSLQPSQTSRLLKSSTASVRAQYDDFAPNHICNSFKHFKKSMNNWLAGTILFLSILSTVLSAIFLGIALHAPRYGRMVGTDGAISVSNAAFLTSLLAKIVELSFVTVVAAYLGQRLARRAFRKESYQGVTLAEMNMRNWVSQPGTMFTQWESVRYAGWSTLGVLAVIAAITATLYTSAATALVQPQLKFSNWEKRVMQGLVTTSFANTDYISAKCKTPITTSDSSDDVADIQGTCVQIEHASQAYHNYQRYLTDWTITAASGNGSIDLATRPKGWALFNDNTTVIAPWTNLKPVQNQTQVLPNGWVVNNITMAFPHPGVVQAAQDPVNGIMQPNELNGIGIYSIRASVPSPFINVICTMGIEESSLKPLVYSQWPNASLPVDIADWPKQLGYTDPFLGPTPFDDIFEWGKKYGNTNWPPVFPILPGDYNIVANDTTADLQWGRTAIYVLGKGGPTTPNNYALCELRVGQTPHCSTQYNASSNVASLEAMCDDPRDEMQFIKSSPLALAGGNYNPDWPNIASMWIRAINMNSGTINSNSSNARLWSELIFTNSSIDWQGNLTLSINLPSPAEALAVMSGCTLLQSAQDAPFTEFWNYSGNSILVPSQPQWFNASVHQQQYASGGTANYERAFHLVLFAVFFINLFILGYWLWHRQWYTDFSDQTNLFALAINSPPSEKLANCSCGKAPHSREKFKHYWTLDGNTGGHISITSPDLPNSPADSPSTVRMRRRSRGLSTTFEMVTSPLTKTAKSSWTPVDGGES